MDLAAYLVEKDGCVSRDGAECVRLASALGTTPYYLYMVALKHKKAGHAMANGIEAHTGGKVKREITRPDVFVGAYADAEQAHAR